MADKIKATTMQIGFEHLFKTKADFENARFSINITVEIEPGDDPVSVFAEVANMERRMVWRAKQAQLANKPITDEPFEA